MREPFGNEGCSRKREAKRELESGIARRRGEGEFDGVKGVGKGEKGFGRVSDEGADSGGRRERGCHERDTETPYALC